MNTLWLQLLLMLCVVAVNAARLGLFLVAYRSSCV
jgi:hypothetical protein